MGNCNWLVHLRERNRNLPVIFKSVGKTQGKIKEKRRVIIIYILYTNNNDLSRFVVI